MSSPSSGAAAFAAVVGATLAAAWLRRKPSKPSRGPVPAVKDNKVVPGDSAAAVSAKHGGVATRTLPGGIGGCDLVLLEGELRRGSRRQRGVVTLQLTRRRRRRVCGQPRLAAVVRRKPRFSCSPALSSCCRCPFLPPPAVPTLRTLCPEGDASIPNKGALSVVTEDTPSDAAAPFLQFIDESAFIVGDLVRKTGSASACRAFVRAGPRASLYFNPTEVRAAVLTCGGLCPGLNNVIREVVETLWHGYGVRTIYGLRYGFWGFHTTDAHAGAGAPPHGPQCPAPEPLMLTPELVASIHQKGGTFLGSDRGGHDIAVILAFLRARGVNQVYVVGGDGTHRGAHAISTACLSAGLRVAIAAIPKTIDNDVDLIDKSFGFDTAFAEAQRAIRSAKVEAAGTVNGIGVVKVMGRHAGFIAAHATLASGDVDACLVPEVPVVLDGPVGVLPHLKRVLAARGHAVVVVAEGAAEDVLEAEMVAKGIPIEVDAGGNKKLPPVGTWLQARIKDYMSSGGGQTGSSNSSGPIPHKIIYIDPSYMIRSVPANPADAVYCCVLAQSSVHGAMAGFTGFSTGLVNNRVVYIPIPAITANSPRRLNPRGRTYERLLAITKQPDVLADPVVAAEVAAKEAAIAAANAAHPAMP